MTKVDISDRGMDDEPMHSTIDGAAISLAINAHYTAQADHQATPTEATAIRLGAAEAYLIGLLIHRLLDIAPDIDLGPAPTLAEALVAYAEATIG